MKVLFKNIYLLFFFSFFVIFSSCKENEENASIEGQTEFRLNEIPNEINNEISIISYEYIDNFDNKSTINVVANCGLINSPNYIGDLKVNSSPLHFDNISKRYVSINPIPFSNSYLIQNTSILHSIPSIGYLNVKSSIPNGDVFYKNSNLTLQWTPSGSNENIKIAICEEGSQCILKSVNESAGNITISSSEFSSFQTGNSVSIYLALNKEFYFSNTLSLVNTAITSSSTGHIIQ